LHHRRAIKASRRVEEMHLTAPGAPLQQTSPADAAGARALDLHVGKQLQRDLSEIIGPASATISPVMIGLMLRSFVDMPHDSGIPAALALVRVAWVRYGILPPPEEHILLVGRAADMRIAATSMRHQEKTVAVAADELGDSSGSSQGTMAAGMEMSDPWVHDGISTARSLLPLSGPGSAKWRAVAWKSYEEQAITWLERLLEQRGFQQPPALARTKLRKMCAQVQQQQSWANAAAR